MRYFMINFKAQTLEAVSNPSMVESFIYFGSIYFPSYSGIQNIIKSSNSRKLDTDTIVITNIFEFKSENDYNNFKS